MLRACLFTDRRDVARPCPFYTRGTCLFADACNFIHTVKSPVTPEIRVRVTTQDYATKQENREHEHERVSTTPPDVANSPSLTADHPLDPIEVFASDILAPNPDRWSANRRNSSWASIHSIHSAGSNLSYPTDPSPTASRASSPPSEAGDEPSQDWNASQLNDLLANIEFVSTAFSSSVSTNLNASFDLRASSPNHDTMPNPLRVPIEEPGPVQLSLYPALSPRH